MIVLDNDVLSELMKPKPTERVLRWMAAQSAASLCTNSVTVAEICTDNAAPGREEKKRDCVGGGCDVRGRLQRTGLSLWSAPLCNYCSRSTQSWPANLTFDAQIAAIARLNNAAIATRNVADFEGCGVKVVDPWVEM